MAEESGGGRPTTAATQQAVLGAMLAFLAVAIGAFTTHTLRARVTPEDLELMRLGSRYQMFHALALLWTSLAARWWPTPTLRRAGWAFAVGTVIFSGSLYAIALTGVRWLGAITPLGGLALLAGWLALAWGIWRAPRS
jgi:uncharacterized membrane protein YgdD (TMEM256/DUF423 family)